MGVGNRIRFEVFKRDSFTCQYCGRKAPDVILEADHIRPVSAGGDDSLVNLVTSCWECNSGKSDKALSDNSAIRVQQRQLEELNERRLQLEMLLEWRNGLVGLKEAQVQAVVDAINRHIDNDITKTGLSEIKKWIRRFGLVEVLECVDKSFEQYLEFNRDGSPTFESRKKAFSYIPKIAASNKAVREKPYLADLFYIRAVLRNRFPKDLDYKAMKSMEAAYLGGVSIDAIKSVACSVSSYWMFCAEVDELARSVHTDVATDG